MALTVSILRQPSYGLVEWNGKSFNYTPNLGFSGSDSFVYSEITNDSKKIFTKYVNTSNTPPVALDTTLSAIPYVGNEIDINSVVVDYTNPFNYLIFTEVSASLNNPITTDGRKIYYSANTPSALDVITYKATDKQFTVTGSISVNVLSASAGAEYSYNSLEKLYQIKDITNFYERSSSGWTGSYYVYATYSSTWDSIDTASYEAFADQVVSNVSPWDVIYDNRNIYYNVHTTLSSNSGRWYDDEISGSYYYGIINPNALSWNTVYNILNSNSGKWNNSISRYNILLSGLDYTKPLYDSAYNTVTSSSADIWDSSDLNNWSSNYSSKLRNAYNYTSANSAKWIPPISGYQELSASMSQVAGFIKSTSSTVYANSAALWDNSNLDSLSAEYYDKWSLANEKLILNETNFDILFSSLTSLSVGVDALDDNLILLSNTVSSNSAIYWENSVNENYFSNNSSNWISSYSILTANRNKWDNSDKISNVINYNTLSFNSFTNIVSANSANLWSNLESNLSLILSNSANFNLIYNILVSNSSTWNSVNDISNIISSYSGIFEESYNTVLANSASTWNNEPNTLLINNSSNWDKLYATLATNSNSWSSGGDIGNVIGNISSIFEESYNTVLANSGSTWNNEPNTLLSSNSSNWDKLYATLATNSNSWSSGGNIGNIIANISSIFDTSYNTVLSNSASNWDNEQNTLLSSNSSNWNSVYNTMTSYSSNWVTGNVLSANIGSGKIRFESVYNLLTANSANNWIGNTIFQSISDNLEKFNQLKNIFFTLDKDSKWDTTPIIYTEFYNIFDYNSPNFISTSNSVQNNSSFWDTTYVNNAMSEVSSNLNSNYTTLTSTARYWVFTEDDNLKNTFSNVNSNSAKLDLEFTYLTSNSGTWSSPFDINIVPSLSSQYLSGSPTVSISSRDLYIYGNLMISQNLSALGSKTSINTSNYTLTSFEVINDSTIDCFIITKSSNLTNIVTFSSVNSGPVLWVKSNNTVSINTTLGNEALNVVGDISASGTISDYLGSQISIFQSNSSKYESAYTFATTNSGDLDLVKSSKSNYDDMSNYYRLSSSIINKLSTDNPKYNSVYNNISSNFDNNSITNDFVTYSTNNINLDTILRSSTAIYDVTYTSLTSVCSNQVTSLNYLFSFNKVVSSDKAKILIPYNLKIVSWSVFTDTPTNLTIDVLSGYTFNKTTYTRSITNNYPITGANVIKSSANNLDSLGWTTNITQGGANPSFMQFNLTRNDSASSVMVNLKAYRI